MPASIECQSGPAATVDARRELSRALARQARRRERYREVVGSRYEADVYALLLKSTRDVMRWRSRLRSA